MRDLICSMLTPDPQHDDGEAKDKRQEVKRVHGGEEPSLGRRGAVEYPAVRRPILILFRLAAALSLLLCLATIGLWCWGHWSVVRVKRVTPMSNHSLAVSRDEFLLFEDRATLPVFRNPPNYGWTCETLPDAEDFLALAPQVFPKSHRPTMGVFVGRSADGYGVFTMILIPMPFIVSLFAVVPVVAGVQLVRSRRRTRRIRAGQCVACGYDLRGSPDRCPECGRDARAFCGKPRTQAGGAG
jgi:hypothetical protein